MDNLNFNTSLVESVENTDNFLLPGRRVGGRGGLVTGRGFVVGGGGGVTGLGGVPGLGVFGFGGVTGLGGVTGSGGGVTGLGGVTGSGGGVTGLGGVTGFGGSVTGLGGVFGSVEGFGRVGTTPTGRFVLKSIKTPFPSVMRSNTVLQKKSFKFKEMQPVLH